MKHYLVALFALLTVFILVADAGDTDGSFLRGLAAHYYKDHTSWKGKWPDEVSVPHTGTRPNDWTFTEYKYSRVEPVVNHLFIRQGWFSVRWKGYFDPSAIDGESSGSELSGQININPNNSAGNEFSVTLPDGRNIVRADLTGGFGGYEGPAVAIHIKPKGNGNQNTLKVSGLVYPILNACTYDIESKKMTVRIFNDKLNPKGVAIGDWWIAIEAETAVILCRDVLPSSPAVGSVELGKAGGSGGAGVESYFEVWADDGCRVYLDGKLIIDSWNACWEESPESIRKSGNVRLSESKHRIVIEYFQGQSLDSDEDNDPMKIFWSCPARRITRQLIPPACFSHKPTDARSPGR